MVIVGVIASVFLAAGLLPPYYEIWKRRGRVVGINWVGLSRLFDRIEDLTMRRFSSLLIGWELSFLSWL
jgi:hypothetical protein